MRAKSAELSDLSRRAPATSPPAVARRRRRAVTASESVGVRGHVSASHVALFTHTIDRACESQTVKGGGSQSAKTKTREVEAWRNRKRFLCIQ